MRPLQAEIIDLTSIHLRHLIPTHVNRNERLFGEAMAYLRDGGWIDLTAFDFPAGNAVPVVEAVRRLKDDGLPLERVTISSDANGSMAVLAPDGSIAGFRVARLRRLVENLKEIVMRHVLSIEEAVFLVTSNVARFLGLMATKGFLAPGHDADVALGV